MFFPSAKIEEKKLFHFVIIIVKIHTHTHAIHTNALIAQPNLQFASIQYYVPSNIKYCSTPMCTQTYICKLYLSLLCFQQSDATHHFHLVCPSLVSIYLAVTTLRTTHTWTLTTQNARASTPKCYREIARVTYLYCHGSCFQAKWPMYSTNSRPQKKSHRIFHPDCLAYSTEILMWPIDTAI